MHRQCIIATATFFPDCYRSWVSGTIPGIPTNDVCFLKNCRYPIVSIISAGKLSARCLSMGRCFIPRGWIFVWGKKQIKEKIDRARQRPQGPGERCFSGAPGAASAGGDADAWMVWSVLNGLSLPARSPSNGPMLTHHLKYILNGKRWARVPKSSC